MRSHKTLGDDPSKNRASKSAQVFGLCMSDVITSYLIYIQYIKSNQFRCHIKTCVRQYQIQTYHITSHRIISYQHIISNTDTEYIDITSIYDLCMEIQKLRPAKANTPVRSVRASEGLIEGRSLGFIAPLLLARTFIQTGTHCHHHSISSIPRKMVL